MVVNRLLLLARGSVSWCSSQVTGMELTVGRAGKFRLALIELGIQPGLRSVVDPLVVGVRVTHDFRRLMGREGVRLLSAHK